MKLTIFVCLLLLFSSFHVRAQKIQRKDAVQALNFIDSAIIPLKPSANNLVAYFQKIISEAGPANNYLLAKTKTDSLEQYYKKLILVYDNAIKNTKLNSALNKFPGLKTNFLNLLTEGRKPWAQIIPVYIRMFNKGRNSLSAADQNLIDISGSVFNSSGERALEWSDMVNTQEQEIAKKYNLQNTGDSYK